MSDQFSFSFGKLTAGAGRVRRGEAFRILLMGDFSGRRGRGVREPLTRRKRIALDVDNWEEVLAGLGTEVRVGVGASELAIRPEEIDDFHPERMFDKLEVFRALRSLRGRLMDSSTFPAAAEEVRSWAGAAAGEGAADAEPAGAEAPAAEEASEDEGDMLGRLLGERPAGGGAPAQAGGAAGGLDAMIRQIVGQHIVPDTDREQSALAARVDEGVAAQMRAILHDRSFQAVEAAWRSVHFLVTHLETDEDLQLHLMDVTLDELADDLAGADDLRETELFKLLVERTVGSAGGEPWSVLAGGFTFDKTQAGAALLGRLAKIAVAAGAPFVAGAADGLAGCESLARAPDPAEWTLAGEAEAEAAWAALRKLPEASHVALALPRMLLRLPYGPDTDPIDAFEFDEFAGGGSHEDYLWGNAAFAVAQVLGAGFTEHGWQMAAELYRDVESVPMHVYSADGERQVKPCAEVYLSDRAALALQAKGLTAVLSVQGRDVVRVRGVAALAEPVRALAGPWGG